MTKLKRGRPASGEYRGKSAVMSFRIRPDTKELLKKTAAASGRSLSQELEHQAHRALFEMRPGPTHALFTLIASTIDSLVNLKDPRARWTDDPYLFDQAVKATNALLEMYRPAGAPPSQSEELLEFGGSNIGVAAALTRLLEVQQSDPSDATRPSRRQREIAILRADLGPLADRPLIFARTAEESRELHRTGSEFADLHRKFVRGPDTLTDDELRRYRELWRRVEQINEQANKRRKPSKGAAV
jgi:hypothetical protein